jgi:hypothetical protein
MCNRNKIQGVPESILKQIVVAEYTQAWVICENVDDDDLQLKIRASILIILSEIKRKCESILYLKRRVGGSTLGQ